MLITTISLDEFLEALEGVKGLFDNTIRTTTFRQPIGKDRRSAVKFDIVFQASCVVLVDDKTDYLLQCGEDCGTDYEDATQEREASKKANELKTRLKEFSAKKNWKVLPGIISE